MALDNESPRDHSLNMTYLRYLINLHARQLNSSLVTNVPHQQARLGVKRNTAPPFPESKVSDRPRSLHLQPSHSYSPSL